MFCPNCGANMGDAKFCPNCGSPIKAADISTPRVQNQNSNEQQQQPIVFYSPYASTKPVKKQSNWWVWVLLVVLAILIIPRIPSLSTTSTSSQKPVISETQYRAQCKNTDYEAVARDPDKHKGKYYTFSGEVVQVMESFSTTTLRVRQDDPDNLFSSNYWYITYSPKKDESRILEGDHITVFGECTGTTTYKSLLGQQITVPSMTMMYYDLIKD